MARLWAIAAAPIAKFQAVSIRPRPVRRVSQEDPMTNLLNDDGSASMATALLMSHHAFRRDIARFGIALGGLAPADAARAGALQAEWAHYRAALHGHHEVEDTAMFPGMRTEHPELGPVFEQLTADHRQIDPLLAAGDRAFAALAVAPATAASVVADLAVLLDRHLGLEEANVVRFIRDAKAFPAPSTDAELEMYAQGFAWSSHGVAPEVLAKVDDMLPAALASRLPAARDLFAARCDRVWGPTRSGASRTSVPDWLARR
jgi:hypothetical protein